MQSPINVRLDLLLRVGIVLPFLVSGVVKALDFSGAQVEVRGLTGLEPAALFTVAVIALQLGASIAVLVGGRIGLIGAVLLAVFTVAATLLAHAWWTKTGQARQQDFNAFWEHVSIVAALLYAGLKSAPGISHGTGRS